MYDDALQSFLKLLDERWAQYAKQANLTLLPTPLFTVDKGRKYDKIVQIDSSRSVHSFIEKSTGNIFKAASWNAPAKHARGNIYNNPEQALNGYNVRYLY